MPRVVLAAPEQSADLAGEHAAAGVVLQSQLPLPHPERGRGRFVEDLLDLLQLDEVIARTDRTEAQPGELEGERRQLAQQPIGAPVPIEVEPAVLLDSLQIAIVHLPTLAGEARTVDRRPRTSLLVSSRWLRVGYGYRSRTRR